MRRLRSITFAHAGETVSWPCLPGDQWASLSLSPPLNQEGGWWILNCARRAGRLPRPRVARARETKGAALPLFPPLPHFPAHATKGPESAFACCSQYCPPQSRVGMSQIRTASHQRNPLTAAWCVIQNPQSAKMRLLRGADPDLLRDRGQGDDRAIQPFVEMSVLNGRDRDTHVRPCRPPRRPSPGIMRRPLWSRACRSCTASKINTHVHPEPNRCPISDRGPSHNRWLRDGASESERSPRPSPRRSSARDPGRPTGSWHASPHR